MNEAWDLHPLGELFEIRAGKTMSAAARNGADKTPFLRASNVLWDEVAVITLEQAKEADYNLIPSRWVGQATDNGYADISDIISRFESITAEEAAVSADLNAVL